MKIDLKINDVSICLGMPLDPSYLAPARISKMGFIMKMALPVQKKTGDLLYWSKNPAISFFDDRVKGFANLDRSLGPDLMCGTSGFLFFNGNRLRFVIVQVVSSYVEATQFTKDFRDVACEVLGQPEKLNETPVRMDFMSGFENEPTHLQYVWQADGQTLSSVIGQSRKNAYINWQML